MDSAEREPRKERLNSTLKLVSRKHAAAYLHIIEIRSYSLHKMGKWLWEVPVDEKYDS